MANILESNVCVPDSDLVFLFISRRSSSNSCFLAPLELQDHILFSLVSKTNDSKSPTGNGNLFTPDLFFFYQKCFIVRKLEYILIGY